MEMIDFECFYDTNYTLDTTKKGGLTYPVYITDPRFELSAMGWAEWDASEGGWSQPAYVGAAYLDLWFANMQKKHADNVVWVAKNCKFDMMILKLIFGIVPKYVIDVEDLTRYYNARMSHRLGDVALMIGDKPKGKTVQFKGKSLQDILDDETLYSAHVTYTKTDIELQCKAFDWFFPHLDCPGEELRIANMTHQMYLNPRFEFDEELAIECIDKMSTQLDADMCGYTRKLLGSTIDFAQKLRNLLPPWDKLPVKEGKPGDKLKAITGEGKILALSKKDQGCKWLKVHPFKAVRDLINGRLSIKSWPTHIKRFKTLIAQAKAMGGWIWIPLKYCGAHTHRWSGTQGVNPQNMAKIGKTTASKILGLVRHLFRAPDGEELVICDSAQIEARCLAWMAGETKLIELFACGGDVYSSFAESLFGTKVFKWHDEKEEYPGQKDKVKGQRDFGKQGILGGGYGMGHVTFHDRCLEDDDLLPRFESGEYNAVFCETVINTYRGQYKNIKAFWTKVERNFVSAWRYKETRKLLIPGTTLCLEFIGEGTTVFIKLPSGRRIRYSDVRVTRKGTISCSGVNTRSKLYGGKLTENIIQSFCRDLICYWMLRCEEEGLPVLLTVHDEIVSIADRSIPALVTLMRLTNIMCEVPPWAKGMPIDVEGETASHYKK